VFDARAREKCHKFVAKVVWISSNILAQFGGCQFVLQTLNYAVCADTCQQNLAFPEFSPLFGQSQVYSIQRVSSFASGASIARLLAEAFAACTGRQTK
jgi:hypothetical protein